MLASAAQLKAFSPIHVLRGVQLAWLGLIGAAHNPNLLSQDHFSLLLVAALIGVLLRCILYLPTMLAQGSVFVITAFNGERPAWETSFLNVLDFVQHWVISVPFVLLKIFRNLAGKPFDDLFMDSMHWVDETYSKKHRGEPAYKVRQSYVTNLANYAAQYPHDFYARTTKRAAIGLFIYACTFLPKIGSVVLPAVAFRTLNRALGTVPAMAIFSLAGMILPKHVFVIILQTYFSTRSLTRQLLLPYFARVGSGFTAEQKAKWYRQREGVLFGFSLPFFLLMRVPYVGVLAYGLAVASAAFLVSKITHSPPLEPVLLKDYAQNEILWTQGRRNLLKSGWETLHPHGSSQVVSAD